MPETTPSGGLPEAAIKKAIAGIRLRPTAAVGQQGIKQTDGTVKRLRERHHIVAKLIAAGVEITRVSELTGWSTNQLRLLVEQTPAFQELIVYYQRKEHEEEARLTAALQEYSALMKRNQLRAEQLLADKLDEEGDELSPSVLSKVSMDRADRTGYGRQSMNVNVNLDLRGRMESLRRKRREVPPSGEGEHGGALSADSAPRSVPPLLDLKAEPLAVPSERLVATTTKQVASPPSSTSPRKQEPLIRRL